MKKRHFIFALLAWFLLLPVAGLAQKVGNATYYSNRMHGRRTSNGTRYHKDSLTCAHKTLPFGTKLKVRNPRNGKEVVVEVTDRGPHRRDAIVDLSYAAAKKIGLLSAGIARVEVSRWNETDLLHLPENLTSTGEGVAELRLLDPQTGNYYSLSEWNKKNTAQQKKLEQKVQHSLAQRTIKARTDSVPRWRVLRDRLTADNNRTRPADKTTVKQ